MHYLDLLHTMRQADPRTLFRVEGLNGDSPQFRDIREKWARLPTPMGDDAITIPPQITTALPWLREEAAGRLWGKWHCAAMAHQFHLWWPEEWWLQYRDKPEGHRLAAYKVHEDYLIEYKKQCVFCPGKAELVHVFH